MNVSDRSGRWRVWLPVMLAAVALAVPAPSDAQTTTPPGQGTVALEATVKTFYKALNVIVVATMDGVEHTYHFTKDLVVHGGKGTGVEALQGLEEGTMVVLHYAGSGSEASASEIDLVGDNQGLKVTEGRVTRIDRGRKEITIRFANGKTETFRLTERAAAEGKDVAEGAAGGTKVAIYYSDEAGRRVAHYFKAVP